MVCMWIVCQYYAGATHCLDVVSLTEMMYTSDHKMSGLGSNENYRMSMQMFEIIQMQMFTNTSNSNLRVPKYSNANETIQICK